MSMIKSSIKKIVFFNGPPGAGKDLAATMMQSHLRKCGVDRVSQYKFAEPIKSSVHSALGVPYSCEHYEASVPGWKDNPQPEFFDTVPREAYIDFSEKYMKPRFGNAVFGQVLNRRLCRETVQDVALISDSGFADEAKPILAKFGAKNCMLVELHRPGCSFANDSRSFIHSDLRSLDLSNGLSHRVLQNDQDKEWLRFLIKAITQEFFGVSND